jgi:hypothetical protein
VLGRRALNRALLERQLLLRRRRIAVLDAVERPVGLQAQVPRDSYVALWSRLDRFRPEALAEPIAERGAVRMGLLRATLHLVTAGDALALRPILEPVAQRTLYGRSPFGRALDGLDVDELRAFDVRGSPLPDPDTPAPIRFLPEYDNLQLGHDDRSRIVLPGLKGWTEVGWGSVLVDGFGAAPWSADAGRRDVRFRTFRGTAPSR